MAQLVELSRTTGWRQALEKVDPTGSFFSRRMLNLSLGNWHLLLLQARERQSLDVGCGFGSLALGMADYYDTAVGVEMLSERVEWATLRAEQDGRHARFIRATGFQLPFCDDSFGLVSLNGVLEWAGLYQPGPPRALQIRMLEEARRVLRADGHVAVAIENRFALETLMGLKDTHTGLTGVTFLPRAAADAWSRLRKGEPYRTWLYGTGGARSLVRDAGFANARVFDLVSSYNDYDFIVDTTDRLSYRLIFRNDWVRSFYKPVAPVRRGLARWTPGLLGRLGYAHLIVGGHETTTALDAESAIWTVAEQHGARPGLARFACQGSEPATLALIAHDGNRVVTVVELGAAPFRSESVVRAGRVRTVVEQAGLIHAATGTIGGLTYRVHKARP